MPIVRIELLEGRPPAMKAELLQRVTDAVVAALGVQPGQVRVLLQEIPPAHWAVGGKAIEAPRTPAAPPPADQALDP